MWVVDPRARSVYAYRSLIDLRELTETDTLSGEDPSRLHGPVAASPEEYKSFSP